MPCRPQSKRKQCMVRLPPFLGPFSYDREELLEMPATPDRIKISLAQRAFRENGYEPPKHRALYVAILDGRVPAVRETSGWMITCANVPMIAEILGCARTTAA